MTLQRAAFDNWAGVVFILVAILAQWFRAMRRGTPPAGPRPGDPPPARRSSPPPRAASPPPWENPVPARQPAPRPAPRQRPPAKEASRSNLPPKLQEIFNELSVPADGPSAPLVPATSPAVDEATLAAAQRMEAAEAGLASPRPASFSMRLRLNTREEWQRAIVVNEILQPPLALRNF